MVNWFFIFFTFLTSALSNAGTLSVAEPTSVWNKRTIRVCWDEAPSPRNFGAIPRSTVQKIIEQEYTLSRTGIEFVGWQSCSVLSPNDFDVILYQSTKNLGGFFKVWGKSTIGSSLAKTDQSPNLYLYYDTSLDSKFRISPLDHLRMIAVHEFGHLAGLRHEHILPEALNSEDKDCITGEPEDTKSRRLGPYDPNSIMNYCWNRKVRIYGTSIIVPVPDFAKKLDLQSDRSLIESYMFHHSKDFKDPTLIYFLDFNWPKSAELRIKIGLSSGDLKTLRFLYP